MTSNFEYAEHPEQPQDTDNLKPFGRNPKSNVEWCNSQDINNVEGSGPVFCIICLLNLFVDTIDQ